MPLPYIFGTGTAWQAGWLDVNFAAVGACTTIPCTTSGTANAIVLTTAPNTPVPAYANYQRYGFIAAINNSGSTSVNINSLGALLVYKDTTSGPALLAGGEIVAGNYCVLVYDAAIAGFHLQTAPSLAAGTVTGVTAGAGLAGGTISAVGTISLGTISSLGVLANTTGGAAAPTSNSMSAILDAVFGAAQGSVLYRGASAWARLGPGTIAQYLYSGGAAANPSWQGGIVTGISAAGNSQGTATPLTGGYNQVSTTGAGTGVLLNTAIGVPQIVWNDGANGLLVYPPLGAQINNLGTNNPATISTISVAGYVMLSSTLAKTLP